MHKKHNPMAMLNGLDSYKPMKIKGIDTWMDICIRQRQT